ncbi:MAG: bifunctional aspartate kinase/homoserine dehydrogenase I [Sphaerochaetaceae bacterium]|nr:bifunctional aspartate kinase/homoserine dehydrogenase I [Sphaerochaeta sp.]MCI2096903.1 bifunctional aspartate kinase/homoserine dehydrogenase I [Sphaerochaeta sp.]MCI2103773.1 bifunctional aspartate kinase/homoserine dehydrogenase I [Sphaerochaeta sp.]
MGSFLYHGKNENLEGIVKDIRLHSVESSALVSKEGCGRLCRIVREGKEQHCVFVLSVMRSLDYEMGSLLESAKNHDERLWSSLEKRSEEWSSLVDSLLDRDGAVMVSQRIKQGFSDIEDLLKAIWLTGYVSSGSVNFVDKLLSSWMADIICHYFVLSGCGDADIASYDQVVAHPVTKTRALFVYGILSPEDVEEKTAQLAPLFEASGVTFWNTKGLLRTADINEVPSAKVITHLSYVEATELSFFGAPIIHPHALLPAMQAGIDVCLRSWYEEENPGTVVSTRQDGGESPVGVRGFSIIHHIALINVEGAGMSGVRLIASRLFTALGEVGISVILITQASSEYSICFAVMDSEAELACRTARTVFSKELEGGQIHQVESESDCAILAAVGQEMKSQIGIAGKFFSSLAKAKVNIRAIAQGSSESNISVVIKSDDSTRALRALHAGFFLSMQAISVGLIGPGNIGGTLLDQIAQQKERLNQQFGLDIRIRAIANSKRMLLNDEGVDLDHWRDELAKATEPFDMNKFVTHVGVTYFPHSAIVDCTTSASIAEEYVNFLSHGIHVITPNKKAGTAPYPYYAKIFQTCVKTGSRFLYETTVGAALPVICTLKDLVQTGDRVHRIEGIVSGTLAWLFNNYDGTTPFSDLVRKAKELGYTEPDPRDDLSGMDVGRKTVILARELGFHTEVTDIPIESLVPKEMRGMSLEVFMKNLSLLDEPMKKRYEAAAKKGMRLRYVGFVDEQGQCQASLREYPFDHPFSQATGTDNVILFSTDRYLEQPLVIKGPGAGRDVTAGGVFSDLLRLGAYLGARI